jgi:hypothetical protein
MEAVSFVGFLFIAIVVACVVLIPVLIGMYVYRDAKARNMDAVLWTLVAVLVPSFIGLIIYLVIRSNNPNVNCPSCGKPVASEYVLCPYCGMSLKDSCPSCAAPVGNGWKLCPKCGTELPAQTSTAPLSAPKKDRKLVVILVAAILAPVLLLMVALGGLTAFRASTQSSFSSTNISIEDTKDTLHPAVIGWIADCDKAGKGVYVLKLSPESAGEFLKAKMGELDKPYFVYVYINIYKSEEPPKSLFGGAEHNQNRITMKYHTVDKIGEDYPGYELSEIGSTGVNVKSLTITIDGKEVGYTLTEAD